MSTELSIAERALSLVERADADFRTHYRWAASSVGLGLLIALIAFGVLLARQGEPLWLMGVALGGLCFIGLGVTLVLRGAITQYAVHRVAEIANDERLDYLTRTSQEVLSFTFVVSSSPDVPAKMREKARELCEKLTVAGV